MWLMRSPAMRPRRSLEELNRSCLQALLRIAIMNDKLNYVVENIGEYKRDGIDELDEHGKSLLYNAASGGFADMVRLLLENGANPNTAHFSEGPTALYAAFASSVDTSIWATIRVVDDGERDKCVELLLRHGAIFQDPIDEQMPTLFDCALSTKKNNKRLNNLIGHLVILDGKIDTPISRSMIRFNEVKHLRDYAAVNEYSEQCRKTLGSKCSRTTLTYLDLLTANDNKLRVCARDKTLLPAIHAVIDELDEAYPYHVEKLRKNLAKARELVNLEDATIPILCGLLNRPYNEYYIIVKNIVGYLNEHELHQLSQWFDTSVASNKATNRSADQQDMDYAKDVGKSFNEKKIVGSGL